MKYKLEPWGQDCYLITVGHGKNKYDEVIRRDSYEAIWRRAFQEGTDAPARYQHRQELISQFKAKADGGD